MKRSFWICLLLLGALIPIGLFCFFSVPSGWSAPVGEAGIANAWQTDASFLMQSERGQLYFYERSTQDDFLYRNFYQNRLCTVQSDGVKRLAHRNHGLALLDSKFYYRTQNTLRCYDAERGTDEVVGTLSRDLLATDRAIETDTGLLIRNDTLDETYRVEADGLTAVDLPTQSVVFDAKQYRLTKQGALIREADGTETVVAQGFSNCRIAATDSGVLIYHTDNRDNLILQIMRPDETIETLFSCAGAFRKCAINLGANYAYLSVDRYERYGVLETKRYADDSVRGTWRIRLSDGGQEKLSEEVYDGLYRFDSDGFFACNAKGCIVYIDLDGQCVQKLLK